MARTFSGAGAVFLLGGLVAGGCSHAWDVLDPLGNSTAGTGSTTSTGGLGGGGMGTGTGGAGSSTTASAGGAASSSSAVSSSAASSSAASSSAASSSVASSSAASSSAASSSAASSSASSGTGMGSTVSYKAVLAACNSDVDLSTLACEQLFGSGTMDVDAQTDTGLIMRGFIRFNLDATLVGKTIDSVTLRLTTGSDLNADSDSSGQIWKVTAFNAASLMTAQPTSIGNPVGADLGAVALGTGYSWGLPKSLVSANASVFLGVDTQSTDGVHYWNDHGDVPPRLTINYH